MNAFSATETWITPFRRGRKGLAVLEALQLLRKRGCQTFLKMLLLSTRLLPLTELPEPSPLHIPSPQMSPHQRLALSCLFPTISEFYSQRSLFSVSLASTGSSSKQAGRQILPDRFQVKSKLYGKENSAKNSKKAHEPYAGSHQRPSRASSMLLEQTDGFGGGQCAFSISP